MVTGSGGGGTARDVRGVGGGGGGCCREESGAFKPKEGDGVGGGGGCCDTAANALESAGPPRRPPEDRSHDLFPPASASSSGAAGVSAAEVDEEGNVIGSSMEGMNDDERPSTLPLPPTRPVFALLPGAPLLFKLSVPSKEGVFPKPPTLATPACSTMGGPVGASGGKKGFTLHSGNSTNRAPLKAPPLPLPLGSCGGIAW